MDQRISGLTECKAVRKTSRKQPQPDKYKRIHPQEPDSVSFADFTETPLDDLLAFAPQTPFTSNAFLETPLTRSAQRTVATFDQGSLYEEEQVLPSSMTQMPGLMFDSPSTPVQSSNTDENMSLHTGISSLRERLSQYSGSYLKDIKRLLDNFSISNTSAVTVNGPAPSITTYLADDTSEGSLNVCASPSLSSSSRAATMILPSSLLTIDHRLRDQGLCIPGLKLHDLKACWCNVAEDLMSESKLWVNKAGLIPKDTNLPESLRNLHLTFRDGFSNTVLHLLAARPDTRFGPIFQAIEDGVDPNAKNTADQNFLHVLNRQSLRNLLKFEPQLVMVLQHLNRLGVRFCDCDIFGRSFFHILTRQAESLRDNNLRAVLRWMGARLPSSRDAFGWTTRSIKQIGKSENVAESSQPLLPLATVYEDGDHASKTPSESALKIPSDVEALISKHARLLEITRLALNDPLIEDSEGRNGLQCIAEACLTTSIFKTGNLRSSLLKRKRDESDSSSCAPMTLRLHLVEQLISAGVNVNNYDMQGNTVLMAFVIHLLDGEDDKTLASIFGHLIENGANLHWRNRQGETALHIAVRLGRKVATKILLHNGANVHSRTAEGKGVLAVGEKHYLEARDNQLLYASIMACMALAIDFGAVAAPTVVQEWSATSNYMPTFI